MQIEQAFKDIKEICNILQIVSGTSISEVKSLLKEIAILWETEEKNWDLVLLCKILT